MNNNDPAIWELELSPAPVEQSRASSHVLFICTRPVDIAGVCRELALTLANIAIDLRPMIVTMCPGITIGQLQSWLPYGTTVVRTMPNTPVECGEGATGIFPSPDAGAHRVALVSTALRITSPTIAVLEEESLLDVVAAISGYVLSTLTLGLCVIRSAPAHFYYIMEALIAVGEKHGLPPDMAKQLVAQSCLGAGQLARDTFAGVHELRTGVCVPGGSTEKAIAHLEETGLMGVIKAAVGRSLDANRLMKMVE